MPERLGKAASKGNLTLTPVEVDIRELTGLRPVAREKRKVKRWATQLMAETPGGKFRMSNTTP